jgi:hypothetical protein
LTDVGGRGVEVGYEFHTSGNDYCDFRGLIDEADWSEFAALEFDLTNAVPAPALLFVYLKERDPRRACRFRVDLNEGRGARRRVSLKLAEPEWSTPDFRCREIAELHVVLDDAVDGDSAAGSVRVGGFRLAARARGEEAPEAEAQPRDDG